MEKEKYLYWAWNAFPSSSEGFYWKYLSWLLAFCVFDYFFCNFFFSFQFALLNLCLFTLIFPVLFATKQIKKQKFIKCFERRVWIFLINFFIYLQRIIKVLLFCHILKEDHIHHHHHLFPLKISPNLLSTSWVFSRELQ